MDFPERRRLARFTDESGAALMVALMFIIVVGVMVTAALSETGAVLKTNLVVRDTAQVQYGADAAVDRALQVLRDDLKNVPSLCPDAAAPLVSDFGAGDGSGFTVAGNSHTMHYSCQTVNGSIRTGGDELDSNYALVTTSNASGNLTFQGGSAISIDGAMYLGGREVNADINKVITITKGGVVEYDLGDFTACRSSLTALTQLQVTAPASATCGAQTPSEAIPHFNLPAPPTNVNPAFVDIPATGGDFCRVFLPGKYTTVPSLLPQTGGSKSANYFASGFYYFNYGSTWTVDSSAVVFGGQPNTATNDVSASILPGATACALLANKSDSVVRSLLSTALGAALTGVTLWDHGTEFVLGGASKLFIKKGDFSLYRPDQVGAIPPVSLLAVRSNGWFDAGETKDSASYTPWTGSGFILENDPNAHVTFNGKVLAPDAPVSLSGKNQSVSVARSGLVGKTLAIDASGSVTPDQFSFQVFDDSPAHGVPPQRRTVKITVTVDGSNISETAVATLDNFGTWPIRVYSWRAS